MENLNMLASTDANIIRNSAFGENMSAHGIYFFECYDKDGNLKWKDQINNVVCVEGKNYALDTILAGSSYSVNGPYLSLISAIGFSGSCLAADTMASHAGWKEVSATTYYPTVATRATTSGSWSAASSGSKILSSNMSFTIITNGGTVKGAFMCYGVGAVNTLGDTNGKLLSAGTFSGGDKVVSVADVLSASYSLSL